ncbi:hypothetical protein H0H87_011689 [Tephrocybe sp. NHM501043]|nr:hypothetical protein H0H87_011689 [Tephrocybe sp. NHM501043]
MLIKLYRSTITNLFTLKCNPLTQKRFYKDPIVLSVLTATLFKDLNALGVVYKEIFNPISLHTLALVLTVIEFCISKWKTSKCEQGIFAEKQYKVSYNVHFKNLKEWYFVNPDMTKNSASGTGVAGPVATLVGENREHACKELEEHTDETDSELDDKNDDEDGKGE